MTAVTRSGRRRGAALLVGALGTTALLIAATAGCGSTQAPSSTEEESTPLEDATALDAPVSVRLPESVDFELPNGMAIRLVSNRDVPLVTFSARLAGGSVEDPEGKEGATALLAQLLTKGAGDRDAAAFQEAVDFVGGTFGVSAAQRWMSVNAEFLSQDTELALDLLADVLQRPQLTLREFENERGLALDGIKAARDAPSTLIGRYYDGWLFAGHPLARPVSGDEASLKRLRLTDVQGVARLSLKAGRTILAVAGDFEPAEMRAQIESRFGGWDSGIPPVYVQAPSAAPKGRVLLVDKPDALQTYFRFGQLGVDWSDPRYPTRYLANTILGGRFTSRLNTALRIDAGLTYGARSNFADGAFGLFDVRSYTATKTSQECMDLGLEVYRAFYESGITADELASARSYIQGQFAPETVETAAQAASMILALDYAGLSRDVVDGFFPALDALTLEDVNRTIRDIYPAPDDLSWVVIGRAATLAPIVARYGEVTQIPLAGPGFAPTSR